MSRQYNSIYGKLVRDEKDIIGHVAYSLYKAGKADYIEKFKSENGKEPEEKDLEHFHKISCMDDAIFRYKMQATSILRSFTNDTWLFQHALFHDSANRGKHGKGSQGFLA